MPVIIRKAAKEWLRNKPGTSFLGGAAKPRPLQFIFAKIHAYAGLLLDVLMDERMGQLTESIRFVSLS